VVVVYSRSVVCWRPRTMCTTVSAVQSSTVCRMRSGRHRNLQTPRRRRLRRRRRLLRRRDCNQHHTRCRFRYFRIAGRATADWSASSSGYDAYAMNSLNIKLLYCFDTRYVDICSSRTRYVCAATETNTASAVILQTVVVRNTTGIMIIFVVSDAGLQVN